MKGPRINTAKWAGYWKVSRRTIQNWVKAGQPVSEPVKMANLIIADGLGNQNCLAVAHELLARRDGLLPARDGHGSDSAADATTPKIDQLPPVRLEDFAGEEMSLEAFRAYCVVQMREAAEMRPMDQGNVTYWHERYLKTDKAIRDAELHAKKMGLSEGQIITREEFERLLLAMGFWMLRGVEIDIKSLATRLVGLSFPEEAAAVLDKFFVRTRFFAAFSKSITMESGVSLPRWCYGILETVVNRFWETDFGDADDVAAYDAFMADLARIAEGERQSA